MKGADVAKSHLPLSFIILIGLVYSVPEQAYVIPHYFYLCRIKQQQYE